MATKELKTVPIDMLKEHPKNPNRHSETQIEALAKSMERYTQYYPIIVDEDMNILCGHGKKLALQHLGRKEADVCVLHGLTETEKLKILVEDNKIQSLGYVEYDKVEEIIRQIGEADILGFPMDYVNAILGEFNTDAMGVDLTAPVTQSEVRGSTAEPITQPNEVGASEQSSSPSALQQFEQGAQVARVIKCPHCGKEIAI